MISRRHVHGYGQGLATIELEDLPELAVDRAGLAAMFLASFDAPEYQPPLLPSTALELLQVARRPDVTFPAVAALIQREPLIASQVLRLAQSPVYRRAEPIRSLDQAARTIGLRGLADLFLQASLTARVFRAPAYEGPMTRLRDHSIATAIVARLVCRATSLADDYAFLCGLLHDVGTAACLIVLADRFGGGPGKGPSAPVRTFWPVISELHEATAMKLAEMWQLPADVRLVIGHHHRLTVGGMVHPLAAVVCVADSIATELGAGFETEVDRRQVELATAALRLTPAQVQSVVREATPLLKTG